MIQRKKFACLFLACLILLFPLCSCKDDAQATPTPADPSADATNPDAQSDTPTVHPLTGLECSEEEQVLRPVAFMIDNEVNYYSEQYSNLGLCSADLIFETNIESNGSGTRMMAVFTQNTLEDEELEIGAVRSARPYFLNLAKMLDAFYVHEGASSPDDVLPASAAPASEYARGMLSSGYVDSYWLELDGEISYRPSSSVKSALSVVSAAAVADAQKVLEHLKETYSRTTYQSEPVNVFRFGDASVDQAESAESVRIQFSTANAFYTQSQFTYDEETGLYVRSQYLYDSSRGYSNNPNPNAITSRDIKTGEKLEFTNVFVLSTNQYAYDKDYQGSAYHTKIDLIGYEGEGYYFTQGKYIPITWKCTSDTAPIQFYTEDGEELVVNPGKSFVNLINQNALSKLQIS